MLFLIIFYYSLVFVVCVDLLSLPFFSTNRCIDIPAELQVVGCLEDNMQACSDRLHSPLHVQT